ncbi:MAG: ABC transporter ATP-binding protein [Micrococcales bacterium]|nr:ABC transporter ATP-binding protein [Micrococcales bacterium]
MAETVVRTRNLVKSYGAVRALDGLDLLVERGCVAGLIGPVGAGKTTLVRILLGLLRPDRDSGPVYVLGANPRRDQLDLHRRIVYVPSQVSLWPKATIGETIDFLGRIRGDLAAPARDRLIERFALDPSRRAEVCSQVEHRNTILVVAFASRAELILLDQPPLHPDVVTTRAVVEELIRARSDGRTVLMASGLFGELEALCDTATLIRDGRDVANGPLPDLNSPATKKEAVDPTSPHLTLDALIHACDDGPYP